MPTVLPDNHLQQVRNLALLARQALALGNVTMSVNPATVADACLAFEAVLAGSGDSLDTLSTESRVRELTAQLGAAQHNMDALAGQVMSRYEEGVRDGTKIAGDTVAVLRSKITLLEAESGKTLTFQSALGAIALPPAR